MQNGECQIAIRNSTFAIRGCRPATLPCSAQWRMQNEEWRMPNCHSTFAIRGCRPASRLLYQVDVACPHGEVLAPLDVETAVAAHSHVVADVLRAEHVLGAVAGHVQQ